MLNFSHYSINKKKKVFYSLQNIFGLGKQSSLNICKKLNINPKIKWYNLNLNEQDKLINFIITNDRWGIILRQKNRNNIQRYIKNLSNRGFRHKLSLPVRGQRTHSNAKTYKRLRHLKKKK